MKKEGGVRGRREKERKEMKREMKKGKCVFIGD